MSIMVCGCELHGPPTAREILRDCSPGRTTQGVLTSFQYTSFLTSPLNLRPTTCHLHPFLSACIRLRPAPLPSDRSPLHSSSSDLPSDLLPTPLRLLPFLSPFPPLFFFFLKLLLPPLTVKHPSLARQETEFVLRFTRALAADGHRPTTEMYNLSPRRRHYVCVTINGRAAQPRRRQPQARSFSSSIQFPLMNDE